MSRAALPPLLSWHRIGLGEVIYWLAAVGAYFAFPDYRSFAASVLIACIFALSLDLVLGFGGIITLGHAMFYGIGAYGAGVVAQAGLHEPISACLLAGAMSGLVALAVGPIILRLAGLPLIMTTLALGMIVFEAANKARFLTGGDDGMQGIEFDPVFGRFEWSVFGQTSYLYALAWLFVMFLGARQLIGSPFGIALQGIRENRERMSLIGTPVVAVLLRIYVIGAFMAGIAGALSAATTNFVGLEVLDLTNSVDVLVMVVLGGVGRLYGGLVGAPLYLIVRHFAAEWNPFNWMFVIGGLLIFAVRVAPSGVVGLLERGRTALLRRREGGT